MTFNDVYMDCATDPRDKKQKEGNSLADSMT